MSKRSVVMIVGGGFGGLAAARPLKCTSVDVILIDRINHHLFQPLLYQVATSVLSLGQIASPIRSILRKSCNMAVVLGTVTAVDPASRQVVVETQDRIGVPVFYDYLILATGQSHSYFDHNEYEKYAPGLKNLADPVAIRNKRLTAFEMTEAEEDPTHHPDLFGANRSCRRGTAPSRVHLRPSSRKPPWSGSGT
jgi:NADH dehydrogenase